MCGIAGIISATPLKSTQHEQLLRMNEALIHRGPDGSGLYHGSHVALAMRRLSIIDLSSGWQPLYNEDKTLSLIANGEIYNYIELQADLRSRGHSLLTGSDCEVILHLYEEYGLDCVQHLRGMFAFALWDSRQKRLMLARDRMGEKPLYLNVENGCLVFASELKSLLKAGVVPFELDHVAILHYFHYRYVPEPMTPVQGVRKLPAAHIMTVNVDPWRIHEHQYWNMEDAPPIEGNAAEIIRAELETVAELIVRSDVPVGVALSSGVDSSAIAALTAKRYPGTLSAFSVGYEGRPRSDERAAAKAFADELKLPFHDIELRTRDLVKSFPDVVGLADDPIADISSYSYYRIMQEARAAGVPVMLQGHGGDELFWGYPWVRDSVNQSRRKQEMQATGISSLPQYLRFQLPMSQSPRGLYNWGLSLAGLRSSWQAWQRDLASPRDRLVFGDDELLFSTVVASGDTLFTPEFKEKTGTTDVCSLFTIKQPWPQLDVVMTRLICQTYLSEVGIAQGDRLSMASSVELRLPLVDYRLVETVIGLRKTQPDHALPPKAWFRAALKGTVPDWVMNRPKRPFQPPSRAWTLALFSAYVNLLDGGFLVQAGVIEKVAASKLAQTKLGLDQTGILAFEALVLELWCRQQLDHAREGAVMRQEFSIQAEKGGPHGIRIGDDRPAPQPQQPGFEGQLAPVFQAPVPDLEHQNQPINEHRRRIPAVTVRTGQPQILQPTDAAPVVELGRQSPTRHAWPLIHSALRPWFSAWPIEAEDLNLLKRVPIYALLISAGLLLGLFRELTVASTFGLSSELDVFVVVMGFHLFLGVQIGNALEMVFISKVASLGTGEQRFFFWSAVRGLVLWNLVVTAVLIAVSGGILSLIFPAFSQEQHQLGVRLVQMLLLPIVFANIAGLVRGALAVTGTFLPGFLAGSIVSLCTISSVLLLAAAAGIDSLVWGVVAGNLLVLALYVTQLSKTRFLEKPPGQDEVSPAQAHLWKAVATVLVVEVVYQGLMLTERSFASQLGPGMIAAFFYAGTIVAVPVSLLAFPMNSTLFPRMARLFASSLADGAALLKKYGSILLLGSGLIAAVIAFAARPIVELLFMRGRFSASDAVITADVLSTLVFALPFLSVHGLIRNGFYSLSDYRMPVLGMAVQWCVVALGCGLLIPRYGVQGLATALVVAQAIHTSLLMLLMMRRCSSR